MFILAAELLAKAVRNNKSIRGFSLGNDEVKISHYADDTTIILDGSEKSLTSAIQILDDFGKITGLKLNDNKTEALWIGSKIGHEQILVSGRNFKWPKYKVKTLGLWLSTDPDTALGLNYNEKTAGPRVAGNTVGSRCWVKFLSSNHWPHHNWFTCSPLRAQFITL